MEIVFDGSCIDSICQVNQVLELKKPTNIYVYYPFFETSDFIFAKGQNFEDIFKKKAYLSDNHECYPVKTLGDEQSVRKRLDLPEIENLQNPNEPRVPCGLKATLFEFIGKLEIRHENGTNFSLNRERLVDKIYLDAVWSKTPKETNDVITRADFLSWYLPQVPGFGTKIFYAQADQGLEGQFSFTFDKSNCYLT